MLFPDFECHDFTSGEVDIHYRRGGEGPGLLLLHGIPQTHVMWHKVAPTLAEYFTVIAADLRGQGDSGKPRDVGDHSIYSNRAMARDQITLMSALGFDEFCVAGHDIGARVAHRMTLDFPDRVAVRHQMKWDNLRSELREYLAHPVCHFRRQICGIANAGFRLSVV